MKTLFKIIIYLGAFILSNFIVLKYGETGLIFTALFLIPFDFVIRCFFHEQWKGIELVLKLGFLVLVAGAITYFINKDAEMIALASCVAFIVAQLVAGIFYQLTIKKRYFIKVNGADFFGVLFDSIIFQIIAFGMINLEITLWQTFLKVLGGFFWYWLFFVKLKLQNK